MLKQEIKQMDNISDRNPDLDEMEERGWAWLQRSPDGTGSYKYGAPYADDDWAVDAVERHHTSDIDESEHSTSQQELLIVSWEEN